MYLHQRGCPCPRKSFPTSRLNPLRQEAHLPGCPQVRGSELAESSAQTQPEALAHRAPTPWKGAGTSKPVPTLGRAPHLQEGIFQAEAAAPSAPRTRGMPSGPTYVGSSKTGIGKEEKKNKVCSPRSVVSTRRGLQKHFPQEAVGAKIQRQSPTVQMGRLRPTG